MSNIFDYDGLSVAARLALLNELRQQYEALAPTPEMWADAPEWAQWYTADIHGYLYWHQREPVFGSVSWVQTGFREKCGYSKLPIGIDSRLCKWQRPA